MGVKFTKYEKYKLYLDLIRDIGVIASVFVIVYVVITK